MELAGKAALVLGASRGIGRAIARALAGAGVSLVLPYHDWPEDTAAMGREFPPEAGHLMVAVDLRDPTGIEGLMAVIGNRHGRLDILINNIERGGMPVVHGAYTTEQWNLEMDTTLKAKWWVLHHALPLMRQAASGAVVILSSIAGLVGRTGPAGLLFNDGYAAANRAVTSLTETWARLMAPSIRVNELMLGLVDSRHGPGTRGWPLLSPQQQQALLDHCLLKRTATPAEVAATVVFLVSGATYMTGATIRMDGGYCLGAESVPPMPPGV